MFATLRCFSPRNVFWIGVGVVFIAPTVAFAEPVTWTSLVGVSATGNSLSKAGSAGWNADAISLQVLGSSGYLEFTATETNKGRMAGLGNGNASRSYTDIEFAIYLLSTGQVEVYESGTSRGNFGSYAGGDRFRVEATSTGIRYRKNGVVIYTSTNVPIFPLLVDTSLNDASATITNATIGTLAWRGDTGVKATETTIIKTGSAGWNAGASSTTSLFVGDGYLEFTATEVNTDRVAGLNKGDTSVDPNEIDFGLYLHADQSITVLESGTSQGSMGTYIANDRFRVAGER